MSCNRRHVRSPKRRAAVASGFRSGFEMDILGPVLALGVGEYESERLEYERPCRYTPDLTLHNGIRVELKGIFNSADRSKMLLVRKANPTVEIRLVFQDASVRIAKNSKTTYGQWATKHGYIWAEGNVPAEWYADCPRLAPVQPAPKALPTFDNNLVL